MYGDYLSKYIRGKSDIIVTYISLLKSKHSVLSIQKRYIKIKIKIEPKEEIEEGFTFLFWFISICINLYFHTNIKNRFFILERYHYNGVRSNRYNTCFYCLSWVVLWRQKSTINVKGLWNRFYLPNVKWFFSFFFWFVLRVRKVPSGRYCSINKGVVSLSDTIKINDLPKKI